MTLPQLQQLTLERQGLLQAAPFGTGKPGVLKAVEQLGYIQIDTLSVVERAHHHTIWSRVPDYQPGYLDALLEERKVFEYWFHAASYLPMEQYRFALPQMMEVRQDKSHYRNADPKVMQYVLDTIRAEGPKRARDFESENQKEGSWWNWKPAKLALERLFMQGDLMVSERNGMQKKYDLSERVLLPSINTVPPTPLELAEYLTDTYLRAYGFTTLKQITHLRTGTAIRNDVNAVIKQKLEEGSVHPLSIEGMPTVYVKTNLMDAIYTIPAPHVRILSPFDNSVIHRDRVKQVFDFDYRMECYTPKEKRQFGYFCLPILFGATFIGRVDCKTHRKQQQLELIHLHIENTNLDVESWLIPFVDTVQKFAAFNNCDSIVLTEVSPKKLANVIRKALNK
jgi:uncharacterized protein YcaQ